ncbi:MAG: UDPGP type 1 family protein [Lachnospiraceae bacterium]|nr:UDPGP type 1 family protein [Lachnospiraceae bacterium]
MTTYEKAYEKLEKYGQLHVLQYYAELSEEQKEELLAQILATDFSVLTSREKETGKESEKGKIAPLAAMELDEINARRDEFERIGLEAIRAGKVGAVLLAGGMGTRLGSDDPKGMYDIGLTKPVYIFERIMRNTLDVVERSGAWIPFFIMTSDKNHQATTKFFKTHNYFGYNPDYVCFFQQEMAPASDYEGRVYMEEKGRISTSPNGNGGWFVSMERSEAGKKMHAMGVEWLNVFAVDNVLQRIADPCFIGGVIAENRASGSKVVRKAAPDEKVGVMCLEDGRPSIIEYYELTQELMDAKDEKGEPAYNFGAILNYLFRVKDLVEIMNHHLPLHVVEKKIPYLDEQGMFIKPEAPNGYKYEQLVLDMVHELESCLPFEVIREREFAPIKNRTGIDSVDSARELLAGNGVIL